MLARAPRDSPARSSSPTSGPCPIDAAAFDAAVYLYGQPQVPRPDELDGILRRIRAALRLGAPLAVEIYLATPDRTTPSTSWSIKRDDLFGPGEHLVLSEHALDAAVPALVDRFHVLDLDTGRLRAFGVLSGCSSRTRSRRRGPGRVPGRRPAPGLGRPGVRRRRGLGRRDRTLGPAVSRRSAAVEARPGGRPAGASPARAPGRGPPRASPARRRAGRGTPEPRSEGLAVRRPDVSIRSFSRRVLGAANRKWTVCPTARLELDGVEQFQRACGRVEDRAVRDVVVRPPVEDLLDDRVLAVHAVVRRAGPASSAAGFP